MSVRCHLPVRASVRDLLADLLARTVTVSAGDAQRLGDTSAFLASYVRDDDTPAAGAVCDLPLAIATGSALATTPPADAAAQLATGALGDDAGEYFREVVNILAKLLNSPSTPHVRLDAVYPVPGRIPAALAGLVLRPVERADYDVAVDGYAAGKLTILLR